MRRATSVLLRATSVPLRATFVAFGASLGTSLVTTGAPVLAPFHPECLCVSIRYGHYRRRNHEAQHSRLAQKRESPSTRNHFRFDLFTHHKLHVFPAGRFMFRARVAQSIQRWGESPYT